MELVSLHDPNEEEGGKGRVEVELDERRTTWAERTEAEPNSSLFFWGFQREYYRQRARGGFGLILSEGTLIEPQGTEWPCAAGIWSEEQVKAWKEITDAVHEEKGAIFW